MGYAGSIAAYHITECADGDLVLFGNDDLLRIHGDGSIVWAKTTPAMYAILGVSETLSGELLLALNMNNPDSGYVMPVLLRLSAEGDFIQGSYLQFATSPVAASSFVRTTIGRHMLFVRDLTIEQDLNTLVCFDDAGTVLWAISPTGDPNARFTDMAPAPGGGVYLFDAGPFDGVALSVSVLGQLQWSRSYGLGAQYGGSIAGAASLPGNQIAFIGRAATSLDIWGDVLVMRTDQNGVPIDVTGYDLNADFTIGACSISATFDGDLVLSTNYGSSDELLMRTTAEGTPVWTKRNGDNLQQFGGDVRVLGSGGFAHLVQANESPGLRYFRSDAALNVEGCYEDFTPTVLDPPAVGSEELIYGFQPAAVTFTDYTAVVSDIDVTEMMPCVAEGMNGPVSDVAPRVWPVPVTDRARISNLAAGGEVFLHDMTGKALRSFRVTSTELTLDLSDLPAGMYALDVPTVHGRTRLKLLK